MVSMEIDENLLTRNELPCISSTMPLIDWLPSAEKRSQKWWGSVLTLQNDALSLQGGG